MSVIEGDALLEQAVSSASTDVVMVDLRCQRVDGLAVASASHPKVLPVRPDGQGLRNWIACGSSSRCKLKESDSRCAVGWMLSEDLMKARVAAVALRRAESVTGGELHESPHYAPRQSWRRSLIAAAAPPVRAQAWLPPKGEGAVSFTGSRTCPHKYPRAACRAIRR